MTCEYEYGQYRGIWKETIMSTVIFWVVDLEVDTNVFEGHTIKASVLKMETVCSSETLVSTSKYTTKLRRED
jgi:hypothetical protein